MSTDKATPRPWAVDCGSIWEENNPPRKGHVICGVETAFNSITIRALPDNLACPSKDKLDEIGEANAALIVKAVNAHDVLVKALREISKQPNNSQQVGHILDIVNTALRAAGEEI